MKKMVLSRIILCGLSMGLTFLFCGCPAQESAISVTFFSLNDGADTTTNPLVTLTNTCSETPTHYMASESTNFTGASWIAYSTNLTFSLSAGNGLKTVYFKVKNATGESAAQSDTITLNARLAGETATFAGIEFVWCPPGTFMMGAPTTEVGSSAPEYPQHQVTLTRGFWLAKYPCTHFQWLQVMGTDPAPGPVGVNVNNHPMDSVSWNEVSNYITLLNTANPGLNLRLPTEAEWEYACRAGTTTRFYWGEDADYSGVSEHVWWAGNANMSAHDVGLKPANPWGLYDMCGSAAQWVYDWYGSYSASAVTDPTGGEDTSGLCVVRGAGYTTGGFGEDFRSAHRGSLTPTLRDISIGFRVARFDD